MALHETLLQYIISINFPIICAVGLQLLVLIMPSIECCVISRPQVFSGTINIYHAVRDSKIIRTKMKPSQVEILIESEKGNNSLASVTSTENRRLIRTTIKRSNMDDNENNCL